jgi:hypothetical protein
MNEALVLFQKHAIQQGVSASISHSHEKTAQKDAKNTQKVPKTAQKDAKNTQKVPMKVASMVHAIVDPRAVAKVGSAKNPQSNAATCVDTMVHPNSASKKAPYLKWTNSAGMECMGKNGIEGRGWCKYTDKFINGQWSRSGGVVPEYWWTMGAKWNFPEQNCCICGKQEEGGVPDRVAYDCTDAPDWKNQLGETCWDYEKSRYCQYSPATTTADLAKSHRGGVVPKYWWKFGAAWGYPEQNCCVCGCQRITNWMHGVAWQADGRWTPVCNSQLAWST